MSNKGLIPIETLICFELKIIVKNCDLDDRNDNMLRERQISAMKR